MLCLQRRQLQGSGTAWGTFHLGNRLRSKAKSEKGVKGGEGFSDLQSRMSEATQPKSVGLPKLPPWDLMGTASQLYEQQEYTNVILKTYETFLSDLINEFNENKT